MSADERIAEIRDLLAEVNTPVGYFPDLNEALDWAFALAGRIDALTAERDAAVARAERAEAALDVLTMFDMDGEPCWCPRGWECEAHHSICDKVRAALAAASEEE